MRRCERAISIWRTCCASPGRGLVVTDCDGIYQSARSACSLPNICDLQSRKPAGAVRAIFDGSVSCVYEVVAALAGLDCGDEASDLSPNVVDYWFLSGAHPVFDLSKSLLDRIEIGGVRRQVLMPFASSFDHAAQLSPLVAAEIVEDDDIPGSENRY